MKYLDEIIALFRQLGGKFDNVEVGHSDDAGFYCYTLDNSKNSIISCPAKLLVNIEDLDINEEGLFISHPENYENNIDFLKEYFALHFNKSIVSQHTQK